jgi:hypothetical protein
MLSIFKDELIYKTINEHKNAQLLATNESTKPIELYVELLLVTDHSVFDHHKQFAKTNDDNLVFVHMRTYFSHFIHGVI